MAPPPPEPGLKVGELVFHDGRRVWRVGLVNGSRARLDPVSGSIHKLLTAEFVTYGNSVNVSPNSVMEKAGPEALTDSERKRASTLTFRSHDSFITKEQEMETEAAQSAVAAPPAPKKAKPAPASRVAAPPPVPAKATPTVSSVKEKNKERMAALAAKAAEKKAAKAAQPPKEKVVRPCGCGCGEQVTAFFAQGHDARFKGWMVKVERGEMAVKDLPPMVQKSYEFKKKGDGFVTTKNYKGEAHKGYDKPKVVAAPAAE